MDCLRRTDGWLHHVDHRSGFQTSVEGTTGGAQLNFCWPAIDNGASWMAGPLLIGGAVSACGRQVEVSTDGSRTCDAGLALCNLLMDEGCSSHCWLCG